MKTLLMLVLTLVSPVLWAASAPTLGISTSDSQIILRWPTSPGALQSIQEASSIGTTNTPWSEVTNLIAMEATTQVGLSQTNPKAFFRVESWPAAPLAIGLLLAQNQQLTGTVTIPFQALSLDSEVAYIAVHVWEEGGDQTNIISTIDILRSPTNSIVLDTRTLHSGRPHYIKLEACDTFGSGMSQLTGDSVRWAESRQFRFIPTNDLALMLPSQVGWKFVGEFVSRVTNGTWKCIVSNEFFSKQWMGTIVGNGKIRVSDNITDFNHAYPGNSFTVIVTTTSAGGNATLVRTIEIDRRPVSVERVLLEDNALLNTTTNDVGADLYEQMRGLQIEFMGLGGVMFNLATTNRDPVGVRWDYMTDPQWGVLQKYLRSDYGRGPTHLYGWTPGIGPSMGHTVANVSLQYLQSLAASNDLSFAILDGHNGLPMLRELIGYNRVSREYLLEWGQYPRFGMTWKGNPYLLYTPLDISEWHRQFLRRFREKAFEKQFEIGVWYLDEALDYAKFLDNGDPNPLFQFIVVVGSGPRTHRLLIIISTKCTNLRLATGGFFLPSLLQKIIYLR